MIGRQDPKWGERPVLIVETQGNAEISDEDVLASVRGHVASWCVPDAVIRIASMPLGPTGKIDKIDLRARYAGEGPSETRSPQSSAAL